MADYILSAPLTGSKVEELLLRVNNNQDFTSVLKGKLDGLDNQHYDLEDTFTDTTTQVGVLDTPKNVLYGPLKTSPSGILRHNADGTIDVLKGGPLFIKTRHRVARTGATGVSRVFQWVEISTDNGASWQITGTPVAASLSGADESSLFFDGTPINLPTGAKIRARFARSSTGTDFGELRSASPSASLTTYGLGTSPSAQLSVYKVIGWNYDA